MTSRQGQPITWNSNNYPTDINGPTGGVTFYYAMDDRAENESEDFYVAEKSYGIWHAGDLLDIVGPHRYSWVHNRGGE